MRLVVAAGLVIDAVVHRRLAPGYQLAAPGGIGQGNLFRIEAAVAVASEPVAAAASKVGTEALEMTTHKPPWLRY